MKTYAINEVFYSVQGEGMRAGTANVFVRFAGCNLRCRMEQADDSPGGFDCDTEFAGSRKVTAEELADWMDEEQATGSPERGVGRERWAVLTGGEPGLQLDAELVAFLREKRGWRLAVETNGSVALPEGLDWITVSPKVAEHALRQLTASEVKYVRGAGQALPRPRCEATHKLLSPAFNGDALDERALAWCIRLVKEHPEWRLSVQQHKTWRVR